MYYFVLYCVVLLFFFIWWCCFVFFFFFSSRRRHTRWTGDWSSDVCSSDLVTSRAFEKLFAPYMTDDLAPAAPPRADYPYVQLRDGIAFVGVSSSVATGDFGAWGCVGNEQLARLEAMLGAPQLADKTRIVMIHHPPIRQKHGEERNLKDRAALAEVLARAGADLVLHGHDHQDEHTELAGPGGKRIPVIGAGSASYTGGPERRSRY